MSPDDPVQQHGAQTAYEEPYFTRREALDVYQHFVPHQIGRSQLVAARFRRDTPDLGITQPNPRSDTCMAVVNLRPLRGGDDIWQDGRHGYRAGMPHGGLAILDHRSEWSTRISEPFETFHIFVPLKSLDELTNELRAPRIETLDCPIYSARYDETMLHLARALLPALERPQEVNTLFADHIFAAIRIHLAQAYGGLILPSSQGSGGLTLQQERRVKDLLLSDLQAAVSLSDLADACGMSVRTFSRAFKATTGLPPHRWLLHKKVEQAMKLLKNTQIELSEVAFMCGFADQSHLTRVFGTFTGHPPGTWRHLRRH